MCVISTAHAEDLRIERVSIAQNAAYYASLEEAVGAAMQAVKGKLRSYEWGGVIVRTTDGRYQYTDPVTSRNPTRLGIRIPKELRDSVVASFHSHPAAPDVTPLSFSDDDFESMKQLGVPMYVYDKRTNRVMASTEKEHQDHYHEYHRKKDSKKRATRH